jgi:hypothetical protein
MVMPDFRNGGLAGSITKMVEELRYSRRFAVS